jgi:hypothetical protein
MADRPEIKAPEVVEVSPPPVDQRVRRDARFAGSGEKRTRYSLPDRLESGSPVGYRTRVPLSREQGEAAMSLLALEPPEAFAPPMEVDDQTLFEESALGLLSSRQSTNYRGQRQVSFGPGEDAWLVSGLRNAAWPKDADRRRQRVLDGASYTHVFFSRPYRTPFTLLLTFVGHRPFRSLLTVPQRALAKRTRGAVDIPTIGYLQQLHLGILADQIERAVVVASEGTRRANVIVDPFVGAARQGNAALVAEIMKRSGLGAADRRAGWTPAMVVQVGAARAEDRIDLPSDTWRRIGANLLAFRSERIQPGVNQEKKAPPQYRERQDMNVAEEFTFHAARAAYNAFGRWSGLDRDAAKELLILDRIDVLSPGGKQRLRALRTKLGHITDKVVEGLPKWADVPTGNAFSRNADRGRKAFALAGQRIYVSGLSRREVEARGIEWDAAVRAVGAAAARGALYCELMGVVGLPADCDLLAGICMMAGPVNQDDIGKTHYGMDDMLAETHPERDPTALLVWTLKAKTIADPIGNEEQLMNVARKGALVDLRPAPHEVISVVRDGKPERFRASGSSERGYADVGNFVTDPEGTDIPGNRGEAWPGSDRAVWALPR